MSKFEVHYSKSMENKRGTTNPVLLEMMTDIWRSETFEADNETDAISKLTEVYGKERINYVLSVTPV